MVIVLLELVIADLKSANKSLAKAHNKLKGLAHFDPLTAALNRHAFHGYLKSNGGERTDFGQRRILRHRRPQGDQRYTWTCRGRCRDPGRRRSDP